MNGIILSFFFLALFSSVTAVRRWYFLRSFVDIICAGGYRLSTLFLAIWSLAIMLLWPSLQIKRLVVRYQLQWTSFSLLFFFRVSHIVTQATPKPHTIAFACRWTPARDIIAMPNCLIKSADLLWKRDLWQGTWRTQDAKRAFLVWKCVARERTI